MVFVIGDTLFYFINLFTFYYKEYVPVHDGVIAKARWEIEQQMGFNATTTTTAATTTTLQTEIAL